MMVPIEAEVSTSDISYSLVRSDEMLRDNYAGLLEFILEIDNMICDLQFTIALRNELNKVIAGEKG